MSYLPNTAIRMIGLSWFCQAPKPRQHGGFFLTLTPVGETATGNRFGSLARSQIGYSAHHAEQSNPKERQEIAAIKARGTRAGCCLFDDPDVLNV